jgi:hypothetical protein
MIKRELWEVEIDGNIERGVEPHEAVTMTIGHWADQGDLRPLAWAIREAHAIDLGFLAEMIEKGRLVVKASRR